MYVFGVVGYFVCVGVCVDVIVYGIDVVCCVFVCL